MLWRSCSTSWQLARLSHRLSLRSPRAYSADKPLTQTHQPQIHDEEQSQPHLLSSHASLKDSPPDFASKPRPIRVQGLIRSIRKQKRIAFAHIQDGSTYEPIQAVLSPELALNLTNGTYVDIEGTWKPSIASGQSHELQVEKINYTGESDPDLYPIQKQSMTSEYLRSILHLRMRSPLQSLVTRARSVVTSCVADHFDRAFKDALQIHPPLITSSDCEGAGEVFTIAPQVDASQLPSSDAMNFFREPKYLTVSSQLHLEAYAAEFGNVWSLSPTFRAEKSDTTRHLAEFYMLEYEGRGINDLNRLQHNAAELIHSIVCSLRAHQTGKELLELYADTKHRPSDLDDPNIEDRWARITQKHWQDWPTVSWQDACSELQAAYDRDSTIFTEKPTFGSGPTLQHERWIVGNIGHGLPTIVNHYPASIKPFYMLPSNINNPSLRASTPASTAACFDILLPYNYAEVCGGSLREHRLEHLINAMRTKGLLSKQPKTPQGPNYPYLREGESLGNLQWYADLRRYGSSPHGGYGIGFDRLLAYLTGVSNVRDVVGFPRSWGRADC